VQRRRHRKDRKLVRQILAGDETAFEQFSNAYIPVLYRFAQRRLDGNADLARDIVQSTLCKVITKLETYRGDAALTTWLCACCRNEIAAHFRSNKNGREVELSDEVVAADSTGRSVTPSDPERLLLRAEHADLVHEALDSLPPHYGRALEWKYLEHLSVKEIASRLNLSPKATESLLTRARGSFRDEYARFDLSNQLSPGALRSA